MYNNQDMSIRFQGRRDCAVVLRTCFLHKVRVNMALWMGFSDGSADKESACNAGDPGSIPGSGRSTGEGIAYPLPVFLGFPCGSAGKDPTCHVEDLDWEDPLEKEKATPLQCSDLENSMDFLSMGLQRIG